MYENLTAEQRVEDAKVLRESGVHKLVIADHAGHCLAYFLAWDSFEYDSDTDTYVCFVDRDGRELMTFHTEGDVKREVGTSRYVVTAPAADPGRETGCTSWTYLQDWCSDHRDRKDLIKPDYPTAARLPS
jgi:hypothetical protein